MTAADLSTAARRLRWAVGAAADAAPDHDDIRTVLAELDAARARVADLKAENERLRAESRPAHEHMAHTSPGSHPLGAVGECECGERFRVVKLSHAVFRSWEPVR